MAKPASNVELVNRLKDELADLLITFGNGGYAARRLEVRTKMTQAEMLYAMAVLRERGVIIVSVPLEEDWERKYDELTMCFDGYYLDSRFS